MTHGYGCVRDRSFAAAGISARESFVEGRRRAQAQDEQARAHGALCALCGPERYDMTLRDIRWGISFGDHPLELGRYRED